MKHIYLDFDHYLVYGHPNNSGLMSNQGNFWISYHVVSSNRRIDRARSDQIEFRKNGNVIQKTNPWIHIKDFDTIPFRCSIEEYHRLL